MAPFNEGGYEETFAYCMFQRQGDTLLLKMLFPLGLGSNGDKEDFERFAKNPYPTDFKPPIPARFEVLQLFRKTKDVILVPQQGQQQPKAKE